MPHSCPKRARSPTQPDGVLEMAGDMRELGRQHGDADLEALGLVFEGLVATRRGSLAQGERLLDEAMASAIGGELGVFATGVVYRRMMVACLALHDYRRAGEWTEVVSAAATRPVTRGSRETAGLIAPCCSGSVVRGPNSVIPQRLRIR